MASYLQARAAGGEWLLRLEDIDPPREMPGAADRIVETLAIHGFRWTGEVLFQRQNLHRHELAANEFLERGLAFACTCTRDKIRQTARVGAVGPVYPGHCRNNAADRASPHAIRVYTDNRQIVFRDQLQGTVSCALEHEIGDFVIRRKDGLIAYSLAVAIDDHDQGITEVVRGIDLLHFTPAQIFLQKIFGLDTPAYMHIPIAVSRDGQKLSKQTGAAAISNQNPADNLFWCLKFLRQSPPTGLAGWPLADVWAWAIANWSPENLSGLEKLPLTSIKVKYK